MSNPDRSYSNLSDSATTFDPEEQFDRDIDEMPEPERSNGNRLEHDIDFVLARMNIKTDIILARMNDVSRSVDSYNRSVVIVGSLLAALIITCAILFPIYR
jgi:hypothetical protein